MYIISDVTKALALLQTLLEGSGLYMNHCNIAQYLIREPGTDSLAPPACYQQYKTTPAIHGTLKIYGFI